MAWGIFKKIKNAFNKVKNWTRDKVIRPTINTAKKVFTPDNIKKFADTAVKLAPAITTAVATSQGAPPATGMAIGSSIQSIGQSLGLG